MDIKLAKWQWDFYNTSKYLSFTDSNKEKRGGGEWKKTGQSGRYNGLIKADGHQERAFFGKNLMSHNGKTFWIKQFFYKQDGAIKDSSGFYDISDHHIHTEK